MAEYLVQDTSLKQIADAIREKAGLEGELAFPQAMADAIAAIEAGGGVEFIPSTTGMVTVPLEIPNTVSAVFFHRMPEDTYDYPNNSMNTDKNAVLYSCCSLNKPFEDNGSQYITWAYNSYPTVLKLTLASKNLAITRATKADSSTPMSLSYHTNTTQRLSVYAADKDALGLRVGSRYRIILL